MRTMSASGRPGNTPTANSQTRPGEIPPRGRIPRPLARPHLRPCNTVAASCFVTTADASAPSDTPPSRETCRPGPPPPCTRPELFLGTDRFISNALLMGSDPSAIPVCGPDASYNNDLTIGSFRPIRYTRAGGDRRGSFFHINWSPAILDRVEKATQQKFFLNNDMPLPPEVGISVMFPTWGYDQYGLCPLGRTARRALELRP